MMERFQIILFRLHNLSKEEQKVICMGHTQSGKSLGSPMTFVDRPGIWSWTQDTPTARANLKGIRIGKYAFKIWISFRIEIYLFSH